jgi:hypothetical protein
LIGIAAGSVIGLGRIAQGAHFASDVVFAYFVTVAGIWLAAWIAQRLAWPVPGLDAPPFSRGWSR